MAMSTAQITRMVTAIRLAVDNAFASETILSSLAGEGYTTDELKAGRSLADELGTLQSGTGSSLGSQKQSTVSTDSDLKAARKLLVLYRTKARGVFPETSSPEAWKSLQLDKEIPVPTNTLITFGYGVVDEALKNPSILSALSAKGYGEEKLRSIRAAVEKAERSNQGQEQKKGGRKESTKSRDAQLEATVRWWGTFRQTARQVLTSEQLASLELS